MNAVALATITLLLSSASAVPQVASVTNGIITNGIITNGITNGITNAPVATGAAALGWGGPGGWNGPGNFGFGPGLNGPAWSSWTAANPAIASSFSSFTSANPSAASWFNSFTSANPNGGWPTTFPTITNAPGVVPNGFTTGPNGVGFTTGPNGFTSGFPGGFGTGPFGPSMGPFGSLAPGNANGFGPFQSTGQWVSGPWTAWWGGANNALGGCPPATWTGWTTGAWSTNAPWTTWSGCTATTTASQVFTTSVNGQQIVSTSLGLQVAQASGTVSGGGSFSTGAANPQSRKDIAAMGGAVAAFVGAVALL